MAAIYMSPILGQEKGPEDQKDPGTGAHSSSILADFPPVVPGSPFPGRPMTSALPAWIANGRMVLCQKDAAKCNAVKSSYYVPPV